MRGPFQHGEQFLDGNRNEGGNADKIVLAVSGNAAWLQEIRAGLEEGGLQVLTLDAAAEAPARAKTRQPFLLLIDEEGMNTAAGDGSKVLETLKASPYTAPLPVVAMLPHGTDEKTQLDYFRRGADDCLVRPESDALLRLRLRALAQRYCPPAEAADKLTADGMLLDLRARKVTVAEKSVALTRKEFDLLNMLMRKRGVVVYTTHLYHSVWGYGDSSPVDAHTVKVHISSLRGKLGEALGRKIVNLPGLGYRFDG
jgi:DNA-binding response OmpR family regulator